MDDSPKSNYKTHKVLMRTWTSSISYFIYGYNVGIFNLSQNCISSLFGWGEENSYFIAIMSSLISLGAFFGALIAGWLSKYYGKRKIIILTNFLTIFTSFLYFIPYTYAFGIARFLSGIIVGCYSMLCSQYISEFTPNDIRGKMGSISQLFFLFGTIVAFLLCLFLPIGKCDQQIIFLVLGVFAVPGLFALLQTIIFYKYFSTESPIWLVKTGKNSLALNVLENLYEKQNAKVEIEEILKLKEKDLKSMIKLNSKNKKCRVLQKKSFRLGLLIHCFQQFSGINMILFYSVAIFSGLGGGIFFSRLMTLLSSVLRIISLFILYPIIDNTGRKKVTVIGLESWWLLQGFCGFIRGIWTLFIKNRKRLIVLDNLIVNVLFKLYYKYFYKQNQRFSNGFLIIFLVFLMI